MFKAENLRSPIVIASAGRSGSTLYYRLLARHRDLAWLSTYNQMLPSLTWVSVLSRLYARPALARFRDERYFPKPFSAYRLWARYLADVARHDRPLVAADVADEAIDPLRRTISRIVRYQGKPRFLMKVTGWARMGYFNRVFPDALFIYLRRDPVAVVESWVRAGWLNVTSALDSEQWEWGEVPDAYRRLWSELGGDPLLSAAVKTQLDIDDLRRNARMFPRRCFELSYEDLIADPVHWLRRTATFCGLEWYGEFENTVRSTIVHNHASRWRGFLSEEDGRRLREFFARTAALGAEPGVAGVEGRVEWLGEASSRVTA